MPILPVPVPILTSFEAILEKRAVEPVKRADYKKRLRYFLDFCAKHPFPKAQPDQVRLFIDKLREKRQAPFQQDQAAHVVSPYFEMQGKAEIPVADINTDTTTSFIPGPQPLTDVSLPLPEPIPLETGFIGCAGAAPALASVGRRLRG